MAFWKQYFQEHEAEWYEATVADWLRKATARGEAMARERAQLEVAVLYATRHELFYDALRRGESEVNAEGLAEREAPVEARKRLEVLSG
jgi:hypothetical protein